MELAIKNDYREIIRIILFDLKEPFGFDTLSKVVQKGSPTVIKMFLNRLKNGKIEIEKDLKRSQIDIEEIEKGLKRLRRKDWNSDTTSRKELIELLSAKEMSKWSFQEKQKHPVYSLQIDCSMSRDAIFSNCINLQMQKPLQSMLEDISHIRFNNLSESFNWCCKENQVIFATDFLKFDIGGIDLNCKQEGRNGFHSACFNGHLKIVNLLLKESDTKKIEVNALTNDGDTAFHLACWQGKLEVVKLLIEEPKAKGGLILESISFLLKSPKKVPNHTPDHIKRRCSGERFGTFFLEI